MRFKEFLMQEEAGCDSFVSAIREKMPDVWDGIGGDDGEPDTSNNLCKYLKLAPDPYLAMQALGKRFQKRQVPRRSQSKGPHNTISKSFATGSYRKI